MGEEKDKKEEKDKEEIGKEEYVEWGTGDKKLVDTIEKALDTPKKHRAQSASNDSK